MPQGIFVDVQDDEKRGLSGLNKCALVGVITDAIVAANPTFASLYNAAAVNPMLTSNTELRQARDLLGLRGLQGGNNEGILTDANIAANPTVLGLENLFVNLDNRLYPTYQASVPQ